MTAKRFSARPLTEVIIASALWGFGFICTVWILKSLCPSAVIFYRFLIAFLVGIVPVLIRFRPKDLKIDFRLALPAGLLLGLTLILQTSGLEYTTATKSAFITTLYVVIVPLLLPLIDRSRINLLHLMWTAVALIGTLLIIDFSLQGWNWGDVLTLANAFTAALHILYVDRVGGKISSQFAFNIFQCFWGGLLAFCLFPFSTGWNIAELNTQGIYSLIVLSIGSNVIAFYLQIRAQQKLKPNVVSLLFLLESPFSYFFAYMFLEERLSFTQMSGGILIIVACVGAILYQKSSKKLLLHPQ